MKVLACRDVGVNCGFHARGITEDDVLKRAAEHARKDHGIKRVTRDYLSAWRMKIRDE